MHPVEPTRGAFYSLNDVLRVGICNDKAVRGVSVSSYDSEEPRLSSQLRLCIRNAEVSEISGHQLYPSLLCE
jgi:hypothetical protein